MLKIFFVINSELVTTEYAHECTKFVLTKPQLLVIYEVLIFSMKNNNDTFVQMPWNRCLASSLGEILEWNCRVKGYVHFLRSMIHLAQFPKGL